MAERLLLSLSYIIHNSAKGISFERSLRGNVLSLPHEEMEQLLQNEWKGGEKGSFAAEKWNQSPFKRICWIRRGQGRAGER